MSLADKRDHSAAFRSRLEALIKRSGLSRSAFAEGLGLDRSALSQILSDNTTRLPRPETLARIAVRHAVSVDWLLGLTATEGAGAAYRAAIEIEEMSSRDDRPLLLQWHADAAGSKIRYVPARIPDLMRTEALIAFDARRVTASVETGLDAAERALAVSRRADTDMEICMPAQTLEMLARGVGDFAGLDAGDRRDQLLRIANIAEADYPGLRLYLFDGREHFSAPFTIFGPKRAAIYLGDAYLVFNTRDVIEALTRRFDGLVRKASVHAHEIGDHVRGLADAMPR